MNSNGGGGGGWDVTKRGPDRMPDGSADDGTSTSRAGNPTPEQAGASAGAPSDGGALRQGGMETGPSGQRALSGASDDTQQPPTKKARTDSVETDAAMDPWTAPQAASSLAAMGVLPASSQRPASEPQEAHVLDDHGDAGEESPTKLFCVCKALFDEERMMIACDRCDEWYHTICMKIAEDEVELVDVFICPPCEAETMQRTTYKTKCLRPDCKHGALRPLSRYCSERCGVLLAASRITKSKYAKGTAPKKLAEKLLQGRVLASQRREGIVMWDDARSADLAPWVDTVMGRGGLSRLESGVSSERPKVNGGGGSGPSQDLRPEAADVRAIFPQLEELERTQTRLDEVERRHTSVSAALDALAARVKLLHLAEDRTATLEPVRTAGAGDEGDTSKASSASKKSKAKKGATKAQGQADGDAASSSAQAQGQPRCGYDERLGWDNARFQAWASSEHGRAMLEGEAPLDGVLDDDDGGLDTDAAGASDGDSNGAEAQASRLSRPPVVVCSQAKRRCKRHADWSVVRNADLEVERELQTRLLGQLSEQAAEGAARLEALRHAASEALADTAYRRRHADEALARRLATEGTRRAPALA